MERREQHRNRDSEDMGDVQHFRADEADACKPARCRAVVVKRFQNKIIPRGLAPGLGSAVFGGAVRTLAVNKIWAV